MLLFSQFFFQNMTAVIDDIEFIKDVLDDHKQDIEILKNELSKISNTLEKLSKELILKQKEEHKEEIIEEKIPKKEDEVESLKTSLNYISNSLLEIKENIKEKENFRFPIPISNEKPVQVPYNFFNEKSNQDSILDLEKFQLLFILKQSRAISPQMATSARQLKEAFSIDKTVRTLHNKLALLENEGLIIKIGKKPTLYFLSQKGLNIMNRQQRNVFSFTPQEY